jgi:hypothetical protein
LEYLYAQNCRLQLTLKTENEKEPSIFFKVTGPLNQLRNAFLPLALATRITLFKK